MISTQMLSSRWVLSAITYSGPITATIGSILVEMKKNRPSRQCGTGCTDSAYAAGTPSSSTRTVETVVAISDWVTYGPPAEKTRRNCARVGEKTNLGGHVWAADSGLNAVITIHSTGRKNAIPTTHARTPQPARRGHSGSLRCPARRDSVVILVPPRTGRPWRTSAARTWQR